MIDDMQFRKDSIWGTCARYFLLIDLSWFPQLCLSAQINSEKLRAYLWLCERGELEIVFDNAHILLPFVRKEGKQRALNKSRMKVSASVVGTQKPPNPCDWLTPETAEVKSPSKDSTVAFPGPLYP